MKRLPVPLVRQSYDYSCGAACLAACLYYWGAWDGREPELYQQLGTTCDGTHSAGILQGAIHLAGDKLTTIGYKTNLTIDQLYVLALQGFTCILNIQAWGNYGNVKEEWFDPTLYNKQVTKRLETVGARTPGKIDWAEVWDSGHYVVLVEVRDEDVVVMDPSIPGRYGRISKIDLDARWHDWSDDGLTKEYHTAIILRGMEPYNPNELVSLR